jgi:hypothetical protein
MPSIRIRRSNELVASHVTRPQLVRFVFGSYVKDKTVLVKTDVIATVKKKEEYRKLRLQLPTTCRVAHGNSWFTGWMWADLHIRQNLSCYVISSPSMTIQIWNIRIILWKSYISTDGWSRLCFLNIQLGCLFGNRRAISILYLLSGVF